MPAWAAGREVFGTVLPACFSASRSWSRGPQVLATGARRIASRSKAGESMSAIGFHLKRCLVLRAMTTWFLRLFSAALFPVVLLFSLCFLTDLLLRSGQLLFPGCRTFS